MTVSRLTARLHGYARLAAKSAIPPGFRTVCNVVGGCSSRSLFSPAKESTPKDCAQHSRAPPIINLLETSENDMKLSRSRVANFRFLSTGARVEHSVKRKQALVFGAPVDNAGAVTATVDETFDLSKTIFNTLPKGSMLEKIQVTKLDAKVTFEPSTRAAIEQRYQLEAEKKLQKNLHVHADAELFAFMQEECNFDMEHADGSFLEHLIFCRDFCALHYPAGSPRVMLLHSICGVGTNAFPMKAEKLPRLASMLTREEMAQVEAFPSILRLLVHGPLLDQLQAGWRGYNTGDHAVAALHFHRVLDNAVLRLSADQLWRALNYQLIHLIDFLPPASWQRTSNDVFFQIFVRLHRVLSRVGEQHAMKPVAGERHWPDAVQPFMPGARPPTWRHWAIDHLPNRLVLKLASKQVQKYSAEVGHSLNFYLERVSD